MRNDRIRYLIVPGWHGSDDAHWQSHWQRALPNAARVQQQDWITPQRADWSPNSTAKSAASPAAWC